MKRTEHTAARKWLWSATPKGDIWHLTGLQVLIAVLAVGFAWLLRLTVDAAASSREGDFYRLAMLLAGVTGLQLLLRAWQRHRKEVSRARLENVLKQRLFHVLLTRDHAAVTAVHSQEWMNRLTGDTAAAAGNMTDLLPEAAGMAVRLVGALAMLLALFPSLGLLLFWGTATMLLAAAFLRENLQRRQRKVREADGTVRVTLTERLRALLTVQLYHGVEESVRAADRVMEAHLRMRLRANRISNLATTGLGLVIHSFYLLAVLLCGRGLLQGSVSYGEFAAALQLVGLIQGPLANGSGLLTRFYAMTASALRLMEAEELPVQGGPESEPSQNKHNEEFSALTLSGVTFRYPGRDGVKHGPVLKGLDITLPAGGFTVLTGISGTGKSTLLKLVMGLYTPEAGSCCLEYASGVKQSLSWANSALFAYVPQGNFLIQGSVREIITLGRPDLRQQDERLWDALELSMAGDFVRELDGGLDARLGEQGAGLSEGQLQRLAIARAICSERPVLILDEATSALDQETERRVLENIRSIPNRTVLAVTHTDTALALCDRAYSLDGTGKAIRRK